MVRLTDCVIIMKSMGNGVNGMRTLKAMSPCVLLTASLLLLVTACQSPAVPRADTVQIPVLVSAPVPSTSPTPKPDWMPEFIPASVGSNVYAASPQQLQDYVSRLTRDGFTLERDGNEYHLRKKNIDLRIRDNTTESYACEIDTFTGLETTRPGTLTCEQAAKILDCDADSLMELYVPDLTEKTGAQIFCRTIQGFAAGDYHPVPYLIKDGKTFPVESMGNEYAVCDIDHDGKPELLYLEGGPTSGVFSFIVSALGFENGAVKLKYKTLFTPRFAYGISFQRVADGRVFLRVGSYTYNLTDPAAGSVDLELESTTPYNLAVLGGNIVIESCPWGTPVPWPNK